MIKTITRKDGDFFFVENLSLRVFGTGKTEKEAKKDFKQHINYLKKYYKNLKNEDLTREGQKVKKLFDNLDSTHIF